MASIFDRFRKGEERDHSPLGFSKWQNMFEFDGHSYGIGATPVYGNSESLEHDFCGYVQGTYKDSGVVFAAQLARMLVFTEMRFTFRKRENGRLGDYFGSPEADFLNRPWHNATTGDLLSRAMQDTDFAGNHYAVIEGEGPTRRVRRLRPDWVDIVLSAPPDKAVKSDVLGYIYKPGGTKDVDLWEMYPVDGSNGNFAHWSPIPDPESQYRGMSWLTPLVREILADRAASKHKLKFFENAATPNIAVSLKESVTEEQFSKFVKKMNESHRGMANAYKTLYLGGGADVTVIGADMQQMDFRSVQGLSETRICAAARVHPSIVGVSEGLQGSSLNEGNFEAARNLLGDGLLRPLWRSLCASYQALIDIPDGAELWYDDRDISFLRDDMLELAQLRAKDAEAITKIAMSGGTFESAVEWCRTNDIRELEASGLFSVQLLAPGAESNEQSTQADTIATLTSAGFTPESVVAAVISKDWTKLVMGEKPEPEPDPNKQDQEPAPKPADDKGGDDGDS
jgi:hypothetical protein